MGNQLKQESYSVLSNGYGIVPKTVMRDRKLSPEAKAIYSYMCSYAGAGQTAFPSVELMLYDLNLSENRFYKHRKQLIDRGYIVIKKQRKEGKRDNNLYILNTIVHQHLQKQGVENQGIENEGVENQGIENECTNNNSINNNSLNNNNIKNNNYNNNNNSSCCNKEIYKLYEELGFGLLNKLLIDFIDADVEIYGEQLVIDAMKEAVKQNKYNLKYVEGILKNWQANGRKSSDEFRENNAKDTTESKDHKYKGYDFTKLYEGTDTAEDIDTENVNF